MTAFKSVLVLAVAAFFQQTASLALGGNGAFCDNLSIIGGWTVSIAEVPFMVALQEYDGTKYQVVCGGSIVHEKFILTAASCISNPTGAMRILVATDALSHGGIYMEVEKVICHKNYDSTTNNNDICLLKLWFDLPLETGRNLGKIVLPRTDDPVGLVNITGWGLNSNDGRDLVNNLRRVTIPVVSKECCSKMYGGKHFFENQICAGSEGHDACQGDSGDPLTYDSGKGDVQIGIASYGEGCGVKPGVYTKVVNYVEWINDVIDDNSL